DGWAAGMRRGCALSATARPAWPYPSGVYSANAGSSARRTSAPMAARTSARARTSCPNSATRLWPPERDPSSRPTAIASKVDGATWPSRCSAKIRTSPGSRSPPSEPFVPEELREFLRLLVDGTGDYLGVALRRGRREPSDGECVRERNGLPGCEAERRGGELLDRLAGRFHDRRERRVPRRVRAELDREHGWERDRIEPLESAFELAGDLEPVALHLNARHHARMGAREAARDGCPRTGFLLEPDALLERILVRAVQLVIERVPLDVLPIRRDLKLQIRIRDLFQTHDDVQRHGARAYKRTLFNRVVRFESRMVDTPWRSLSSPDGGREYLALLSYLPLKGFRKMLTLQRQSSKVGRQLAETRGLVGYSFRAKFASHRFWTLSIWEDEQALMAFVGRDPHRATMGLLQPY